MVRLSTAGSSAEIINDRDNLITQAKAAATVASVHAAAVDRDARFPTEALEEIRQRRLLGIMVPKALGGEGASFSDIVEICYTLGQACGSTAMIYAMHQVKMACIVKHTKGSATLEQIVRRIAADQLLLASSTTEGQAGGNVRASEAAVEQDGTHIKLERKATCISYGLQADGIVTTARRSANALPSDQVLIVLLKSDYTLEPVVGWDTLGMRGTCSDGFTLRARADQGSIVPEPYEKIHMQSMVPAAHLMWGAVWAGIAAAATTRAQGFVRNAVRQSNGQMPPGASHYTNAAASLRTLLSLLESSLRKYEQARDNDEVLRSLAFQSMITMTKVEASELATATVLSAMRACGLSGYRNDDKFSVARHLRDVLSSPIMINNDRILANLANPMLMTPVPASIST
jgi:acyl-CoA dehydrogenase